MEKNNIKISACILSRNDSQFIKDCILHVTPYVDEIIILDSSDDDTSINIVKSISDIDIQNKLIIKQKKEGATKDFSKERNELQSLAKGDYVLHIDCDERLETRFLIEMKNIIKCYLDNKALPILFRFPRLNQPNNVNYPDYQIRLLNRKYSLWTGNIHEVPEIVPLSPEELRDNDMNIINLITIDTPIIHIHKDKTKIWERWDDMMNNNPNYKRLLLISLFKNSARWTKDILKCMTDMYNYNRIIEDEKNENKKNEDEKNENKKHKLHINFSFVDGDSTDGTFSILDSYRQGVSILNIQLRQFESMENFAITMDNTPKNLNIKQQLIPFNSPSYRREIAKKEQKYHPDARFKKLAYVRNLAIEQSVSGFNLGEEDYILFADSDIKFSENLVHDLIKDMEECGADIIAPMVYIENYMNYGNSYFYDSLAFRTLEGKNFNHSIPYVIGKNMDKPFEVGSVGSFFIMKYKVAKNVKYTGEHDSEQVEFSANVRSKGYKIFVSPRLSVLHINFDNYKMGWH